MFTEKGGLKSCSARQHHILWGRTGCKLSRGGEKKLRAQARRTGEPQLTLRSWWVAFLFRRGKEKDEPYFKCVKEFFFIRWDFFCYYYFFFSLWCNRGELLLDDMLSPRLGGFPRMKCAYFLTVSNRPSLLFSPPPPSTAFNVYTVAGN